MNRLTKASEIEDAQSRINALLKAGSSSWFFAEGASAPRVELHQDDWDLYRRHEALFLTCFGARGARIWRVKGWVWTGAKLLIEATSRAGAENSVLEFVPRASAADGKAAVVAARAARCQKLALLACEATTGAQTEGARLSTGARRGEPGRYARILLRRARERICLTGPVVPLGAEAAEAFLTSALLWFARLTDRRKARPERLWLAATHELALALAERVALLRAELRRVIELFEMDEAQGSFNPVRVPLLNELLEAEPRAIYPIKHKASATAERIMELAPDAVDLVRTRGGETLRFRGLAFARVRRVIGSEAIWFGVDSARRRRVVDDESWNDFLKLFDELVEHRRPGASNQRHALYRAAPEAWLESILRRDITRLDPGLRLAPLHAQFRLSHERTTGSRPVDLLALRRDGRLVVIELKVSEDAALPIQGADYWRRISAYHRSGRIRSAHLFGDAEISDQPPLVYLVAPLLSFHRAFQTLAMMISPEIKMYRFDLNEDWRTGVSVARRSALT